MNKYGVTNADFGRYTVAARKYAATNPAAWFYNRPITLDDHQASRWIVEPILRLLDCCQESDGGVALIVTTADRGKATPNPVRIEAVDTSHLQGGDIMYDYYRPEAGTRFSEAGSLGTHLFETAGVTKDDIDVCTIYENFSPVVLMQL